MSGGLDECGEPTKKGGSVAKKSPQAQRPAAGGRLAASVTVIEAKDQAADRGADASAGVSTSGADSAGALPQRQQMLPLLLQQQQAQQAAAPAAADPASTQMELAENDEQPTSAEPRVAAAAPHKWQAVAAGTAVGVAVGVGGKPPAGDEGWTTVLSRRARQQGRARLEGRPRLRCAGWRCHGAAKVEAL